MLAKIDWTSAPCEPVADIDYTGFPHWVALAAEPNRERKAADWLKDKLNIHVYWPHFTEQRRYRGRSHIPFFRSVLPGVLLAPAELMDIADRDAILDWAHLRRIKLSRFITKAEVEIIREIEARLSARANGHEIAPTFAVGQLVRFLSDTFAAYFGDARVIEIASGGRISIKMQRKLFGGKDVIWTTAAELEAM